MIDPVDLDAAARGRDRLRRAGLGGVAGLIGQGLNIGILILTVPLASHYLGQERYGVWVTIMSFFTLLIVTDLGISSALLLALSETRAHDDETGGRRLVATAFWSLVGIALIGGLLAAAVLPVVGWAHVFNTSAAVSASELAAAGNAAVAIILLSIPLTIVPVVYQAYQEAYVASVWGAVASLVALAMLLLVINFHGDLVSLVLAFAGAELGVMAINAIYLFGFRRRGLRPLPGDVSRAAFVRIRGLGAKYLAVRGAELGMFQSQPLIIAQVLGAAQVGVFYVTYRLISLPTTVIVLMTDPLLPAYAEARARGDWTWVWKTLARTTAIAAGFSTVAMVVIWLTADFVIRAWAEPTLVPARSLLLWLVAYGFVCGVITPLPVLLYGSERVGKQALIAVGHGAIVIIGGLLLTRALGLVGMAMAMLVAVAAFNAPLQVNEIHRLRKSVKALSR
jgi:O-antigen/teichoic acid export membrane protein